MAVSLVQLLMLALTTVHEGTGGAGASGRC